MIKLRVNYTFSMLQSLIAALALFSMFFGAGDLIWPLILGGASGNSNPYALLGLLITGVSLPLLGLIAMTLFQGRPMEFFGRIGKIPCPVLMFVIQAILGPLGSLPRIIALSHSMLRPYLPAICNLTFFSIIFSVILFLFVLRRQKIISTLGIILTPLLLLCLCFLFIMGFSHPPQPISAGIPPLDAFTLGLRVGYNTLDLIASFFFAPLILAHFSKEKNPKILFKRALQTSIISALLLSSMYFGLTHLASLYTPYLPFHLPEERLREIATLLIGSKGGVVASLAIVLACLTTAIPLVAIFADYIRNSVGKENIGKVPSILVVLSISAIIANLGFTGIANMLSPILQILCPGLIVLSILNILHKLYDMKTAKTPVYTAFFLSMLGYSFFL